MTKPNVTRMMPKFSKSIRQHMPLMLGQKGLGAAIVSTVTPPLREVRVLTVLATEGAAPLRYDMWLGALILELRLQEIAFGHFLATKT